MADATVSPMAKVSCFRIENLTFKYPSRENSALHGVDLTIDRGEFVTLCGPSGCGKTTLLRHLKPSTEPHGERGGRILFENTPLDELSSRDASSKIGFVFQSPENQIVTDKVWHELAFGLESLGIKTPEIRLRVAEMASFFGIQTWFHKSVTELSGGQKQILALASIMALQPSALILDEPTSQLDPIAAGEFLATVGKINRELGVTVILTEHRLEEAFPLSSRAIVMDGGKVIADGSPHEVGGHLRGQEHGMFLAMPVPMRVWAACTAKPCKLTINNEQLTMDGQLPIDSCPITVRDGARWLEQVTTVDIARAVDSVAPTACDEDSCPAPGRDGGNRTTETVGANCVRPLVSESSAGERSSPLQMAVDISDVWFKYEKDLPDIVKGLSFQANYGEITAVLGGNGTGKTTTLGLIAGLHKPYRGKVGADEQIYTLPQNPQMLFVAKTVREDLLEILSERRLSKEEKLRRLAAMVKLCRLEGLLESHPYDLSGGEQQRAALAKVLLLQPKILLLDEPTKGLDAEFKQIFASILKKLTGAGASVIMVSHDVEFCAEHADRCALFFDGDIVTENTPRAFFSGNSFYTTGANRMARDILPKAITADDIILALGGKITPPPQILDMDAKYEISSPDLPPPPKTPKLSGKRKVILSLFILWLIASVVLAVQNSENLGIFIGSGNAAIALAQDSGTLYAGIMTAIAVGIMGIFITLSSKREEASPQARLQKQKLSKRSIMAAALIFLTIPLTIYLGIMLFGDLRFYFISMLVILQIMLPFAFVFEGRKPQARELIIIAMLCAIAVAGRSAFFMLPQFKPVVAMVIIAGVAFGGETGFLVGAMSMFISNFYFGQGPHTPWQMFAMGIIGFLAGVLFRRGLLSRSSISLAVFGGFATFIIYGGIMAPQIVLAMQPNPTFTMILAAFIHSIAFNLIHAVATVTFLLAISKPMLEKLDRIKLKYGLVHHISNN